MGSACNYCTNDWGCSECNCDEIYHDEDCNLRYCGTSLTSQTLSCDGDTSDNTDNTDDTSDTSDATTTSDDSSTLGYSDYGGTTIKPFNLINTDAAIAHFFNNGITGSVVVINGNINISLDFSEFSFEQLDDVGGDDCFKGRWICFVFDWFFAFCFVLFLFGL